MKRTSVLLFLVALACPLFAQDMRFDCATVFGPGASHSSLKAYFGEQNVVTEDLDVGEGNVETGTVVYPDDPSRRVEILWKRPQQMRYPDTVRVGDGETRQSVWRSPKGVTLGTTLRRLEQINGSTFRLYGFGWDYGGTVSSWSGGALEKSGRCVFSAWLQPDPDHPSEFEERVSGDEEYSSGHPAMRAVNPLVFQMSLNFPD